MRGVGQALRAPAAPVLALAQHAPGGVLRARAPRRRWRRARAPRRRRRQAGAPRRHRRRASARAAGAGARRALFYKALRHPLAPSCLAGCGLVPDALLPRQRAPAACQRGDRKGACSAATARTQAVGGGRWRAAWAMQAVEGTGGSCGSHRSHWSAADTDTVAGDGVGCGQQRGAGQRLRAERDGGAAARKLAHCRDLAGRPLSWEQLGLHLVGHRGAVDIAVSPATPVHLGARAPQVVGNCYQVQCWKSPNCEAHQYKSCSRTVLHVCSVRAGRRG